MINRSYFYFNHDTTNPYDTLALEEAMLESVGPEEIIMYLYTHSNSVIIGKNQNAWHECRIEKLENEGGRMARRISGGGAVFHDEGNLNFSFIVPRDDYDLERQLRVILNSVRALGIDAEFTGRNDITVCGKKFSGNAFCFKKDSAFHHGTIMIDVDIDSLTKYLTVSKDKIVSKGIDSVRSRVCNLKEFSGEINTEKMAAALKDAFEAEYGNCTDYIISKDTLDRQKVIAERNASWDWRFGYYGDFDIAMSTRFSWGSFDMNLKLEDARIVSAAVFSDAMDTEYIDLLTAALQGRTFSFHDMDDAIRGAADTPEHSLMAEDISSYIKEKTV